MTPLTLVLVPHRGELPKSLGSWAVSWATRAKVKAIGKVRGGVFFWTFASIPDTSLQTLISLLSGAYRIGIVLEDPKAPTFPAALPPRTPRASNPHR
jgi:hypothetical protein